MIGVMAVVEMVDGTKEWNEGLDGSGLSSRD